MALKKEELKNKTENNGPQRQPQKRWPPPQKRQPKKKTATQSGATVVINLPNIYLILYII